MNRAMEMHARSTEKSYRVRRIVSMSIAAAALIGGSVVVGQSATAANRCAASQVCLFDYDNFTSQIASRGGGGGLINLATSSRDKTSSWGNDTVYDGCLYDEPDGVTAIAELDSFSSDYFNIDRRDRVESWKTNGSC